MERRDKVNYYLDLAKWWHSVPRALDDITAR